MFYFTTEATNREGRCSRKKQQSISSVFFYFVRKKRQEEKRKTEQGRAKGEHVGGRTLLLIVTRVNTVGRTPRSTPSSAAGRHGRRRTREREQQKQQQHRSSIYHQKQQRIHMFLSRASPPTINSFAFMYLSAMNHLCGFCREFCLLLGTWFCGCSGKVCSNKHLTDLALVCTEAGGGWGVDRW